MSFSQHQCNLSLKDTSGLPRLAPNASRSRKFCRYIRKLFLMSPSHYGCKKLFRNHSAIKAERKRHAAGPHFFVIHPLSTFNSILELVFFVVWMTGLVFVPYEVFSLNKDVLEILYWRLSHVKLVLVLLLFNVGYMDETTKGIVLEPKKIICRYLRTYFVFDFLTVTNIITPMTRLATNDEKTLYYSHAIPHIISILASCVRIGTLLDFLKEILSNFGCRKHAKEVIIHVIRTYIYIHLGTFIVYFIPATYYIMKGEGVPPGSWLMQSHKRKLLLKIKDAEIFKYTECLIMTFCYFFGLTYMYDISETVEQMCFILVSFFGRLYTLFLLADILRLFGFVGVSEGMYENRISVITQFMVDKKIPERVLQRILKFCDFKFQGRYFKEKRILNTLSENLRTEIFLFSARNLIQKVEIFNKLPNFTLGAMMASMRSETYSSDDLIIKIGAPAEEIYFINSGTVAVVNSRDAELCHMEDGEVFGTSCLFIKTHVYAVAAVETTEVFIIGKDQLLTFFRPYPQVMIGFLRSAQRYLERLKVLDDNADEGSIDLLSQLQRGAILEKFVKRVHAD